MNDSVKTHHITPPFSPSIPVKAQCEVDAVRAFTEHRRLFKGKFLVVSERKAVAKILQDDAVANGTHRRGTAWFFDPKHDLAWKPDLEESWREVEKRSEGNCDKYCIAYTLSQKGYDVRREVCLRCPRLEKADCYAGQFKGPVGLLLAPAWVLNLTYPRNATLVVLACNASQPCPRRFFEDGLQECAKQSRHARHRRIAKALSSVLKAVEPEQELAGVGLFAKLEGVLNLDQAVTGLEPWQLRFRPDMVCLSDEERACRTPQNYAPLFEAFRADSAAYMSGEEPSRLSLRATEIKPLDGSTKDVVRSVTIKPEVVAERLGWLAKKPVVVVALGASVWRDLLPEVGLAEVTPQTAILTVSRRQKPPAVDLLTGAARRLHVVEGVSVTLRRLAKEAGVSAATASRHKEEVAGRVKAQLIPGPRGSWQLVRPCE